MNFFFAAVICKLLYLVGKIVGKGTSKPGDIALSICPDLFKKFKIKGKVICITGTNGKTTTSNMVTHILRKQNFNVINNSFGSNMLGGIATLLLASSTLSGKVNADYVVLEVDERWLRFLTPDIHPDYIVVTNLLRDQIMRNCSPEIVLDKINLGITEGTTLILNANDPVSQQLSWNRDNKVVWFALGDNERTTKTCVSGTNDAKVCPKCLHPLSYDYYHYNHVGYFKCENCGFETPKADYIGTDLDFIRSSMKINGKISRLTFDATYFMFNTVTAVAVCTEVTKLPLEKIIRAAETFNVGITKRYEQSSYLGRNVQFILTKQNPASVDQSVIFVSEKKGPRTAVIIAGNMFHTENKDVLYMYDVAYENLKNVEYIIICGPRRYDMAVRFKYAGIDMSRVQTCTEDEIDSALAKTKGNVYVLSPLHAQTKKGFLRGSK